MKRSLVLIIGLAGTGLALGAPPPPTDTTQMANATSAASAVTGQVARAAFTSAVVEREPADSILSLGNNETNIYFYTDLRDLEGHSVVHRWEYNGRPMGEVRFDVKGPRWRVWSSKSLNPDWLGQWRVTVVDDTGAVLVQRDFNYTRALTSMNDIKPGSVQ